MLTRLALIVVCLMSAAVPAHAEQVASKWADQDQASVRLIAAADALGSDGVVRAGVEFRMAPHWKVYWRSPGDAGFPPQLDFTGSKNAEPGSLAWPVPVRFSVLGLETLGYEDAVVLPFTVTAPDPSKPAEIKAQVRYLTCNDICIPYDATLTMTVPVGSGAPTKLAHTLNKFAAQVPRDPAAARFEITSLRPAASAKALYLIADVTSEIPFKSPDLYIEGPAGWGYGAPEVALGADSKQATLKVAVSGYDGAADAAARELVGTPLTLTVVDGRRAAEARMTAGSLAELPAGIVAAPASDTDGKDIATILLFAFLGGLILNLMPCVLPVLSIKILGVIKHGGGAKGPVRTSFLASAAGILFSFMLLAAALIGLKAAGAGIGWGIQFQHPWFLIAMAILVTLFACNLWGFFDVRLPGRIADASLRGSSGGGVFGSFLQGAFATLLATPCSAPFLGTAVGFALARGGEEIALIFAVLGLGLAFPFLIVAAFPGFATALPRPGPWMRKLQILFGFALAATALWLLSVIAGVSSSAIALLTGAILIAIVLWLGPVMRSVPEIAKATPFVLLAATVAPITAAYIGDLEAPLDPAATGVSKINWQRFDQASLEKLVGAGKIVFVDVTADWCITCMVNKRLVLENGRLLELLNGPDVVAMQADWTRPDAEIADYLAKFGRYGIPFNAVYGPNAPSGEALPELLSEGNVLAGFRAAVPALLTSQFE